MVKRNKYYKEYHCMICGREIDFPTSMLHYNLCYRCYEKEQKKYEDENKSK